jgi:hypothetical protein
VPALEALTEEECYLVALLQDVSGLDLAEFCFVDANNDDLCFRAHPYQVPWWRSVDALSMDQSARSVGKSLSIKVRMFAFPFLFPGQEAVVTAPELVHLEPIVNLIEEQFDRCRLGREMLSKHATHRPFMANFVNGSRIIGRIPQRDGRGIKGCVGEDSLILTMRGLVRAAEVVVGDFVWSHELRWTAVTAVDVFDDDDCYELRGAGSRPTIVNERHRVYGRDGLHGPKQAKRLGHLGWANLDRLREDRPFYWVGCTDFPSAESPPIPNLPYEDYNRNVRQLNLTSESFWWLTGRWIADGFTSVDTSREQTSRGRVHFIAHPSDQEEILKHASILGVNILSRSRLHSSADDIKICSTPWVSWLNEHFKKGAAFKELPAFVFFLPESLRSSLLEGYLSGDGTHTTIRPRHTAGSASSKLAMGIGILGQTLGYGASFNSVEVKVQEIMGTPLKNKPHDSHRVNLAWKTHAVFNGSFVAHRLKSVIPVGRRTVVNIVSADHSFLANGIFHHNTHPIWLDLDEGQDYPSAGWKELIETVKTGQDGATWRAHGVTRGVRDAFYEYSKHATEEFPLRPLSHTAEGKWTVHKIPAMARPDWSDEERQRRIEQYGSRDDPDYRRNVLGAHGDSQSPLFVMHRLVKCVDDDPSSEFNTDEYWHLSIKDTELTATGQEITDLIDPPSTHSKYKTIWMGADIGMTIDPTEILIAAEYPLSAEEKKKQAAGKAVPLDGASRLKIIGRVSMNRIAEPDQADAIIALIDHYRPEAFAMDSTGIGLPLFQNIQRRMQNVADTLKSARARKAAECIKPYNFSSRILVEIDETVEMDDNVSMDERVAQAGIKRLVIEVSTDILRTYVDEGRLWLPWDRELISQFQGQSFSYSKAQTDAYGRRRIFSQGDFHALDAARMLALGHKQHAIEALMSMKTETAPVIDTFMTYSQLNGGSSDVAIW